MKTLVLATVCLAVFLLGSAVVGTPDFLAYDEIVPETRLHYLTLGALMAMGGCLVGNMLNLSLRRVALVVLTVGSALIFALEPMVSFGFWSIQFLMPVIGTTMAIVFIFWFWRRLFAFLLTASRNTVTDAGDRVEL